MTMAASQEPINQLTVQEKRWFAIYTKFKCEKFVAEHLQKKGITSYVPLQKKTKRYQRKIKHYEIPLINCYVFVCIDKSQYLPTLETEYVLKFLRSGKDLLSIPENEILTLKRVVGDVESVEVAGSNAFEPGEEVEIIQGHLTGLKGRLISAQGKHQFIISLQNLGFELRLKVNEQVLRKTTIGI